MKADTRIMSTLRICFFTDTFFPFVGGAETVLHNLALRLTGRGVDVTVLAPQVRKCDNRLDVPYRVVRYSRPSSKRFAVRQTLIPLVLLHTRHRFDLLHCHAGYPQAYVGATFRRLFGVPMVVRPHGSDILPNDRIRRCPRLERRLCRSLAAADAVIAQGAFLADVIRELGVADKQIRVIHNGVSLDEFRTAALSEAPRPYILGIGNLLHKKGFDVLLKAWARCNPQGHDLVIAGDGQEKTNLETLTRELGIADRVQFLGHVTGERKASLYRSARFLVCPSRSEPFANIILEGLAAGLPVVASTVGGNTESVRDGEHGLLFPNENDAELADRISRLLENPPLLDRLRAAVPAFIERFGWERITDEYLALYEEIVARRRCPPQAHSIHA